MSRISEVYTVENGKWYVVLSYFHEDTQNKQSEWKKEVHPDDYARLGLEPPE